MFGIYSELADFVVQLLPTSTGEGGVRLVTRTGNWDIAALNMQTS